METIKKSLGNGEDGYNLAALLRSAIQKKVAELEKERKERGEEEIQRKLALPIQRADKLLSSVPRLVLEEIDSYTRSHKWGELSVSAQQKLHELGVLDLWAKRRTYGPDGGEKPSVSWFEPFGKALKNLICNKVDELRRSDAEATEAARQARLQPAQELLNELLAKSVRLSLEDAKACKEALEKWIEDNAYRPYSGGGGGGSGCVVSDSQEPFLRGRWGPPMKWPPTNFSERQMNPIKIAVVGFGDFGSRFVRWLRKARVGVETIAVVDPIPGKIWGPAGVLVSPSIHAISQRVLSQVQVFVDCTSKGQGKENLGLYQALGRPAVFQNGEDRALCQLFRAGSTFLAGAPYLRIPQCSALATMSVFEALHPLLDIRSVYTLHAKINNKDKMLGLGDKSAADITTLAEIPAVVDVWYLREKPKQGRTQYVYHGNLHFQCGGAIPSADRIRKALMASRVPLCTQELDSLISPRLTQTHVVAESISVQGNSVRMNVISWTPEVNFPQNLAAIKLLAKVL